MEEKKLKIYYFSPENSGVGYYRFYQPLEELKEKELIELKNWGFDFTGKRFELPSVKELREISEWGDIFIFGRLDIPEYFKIIQIIREFSKKPVLLDIDDNIFSISPYLPAKQAYDPNGQVMAIHKDIAKYVDGIIVSTPALETIYKSFNKTWIIPNGVKYLYEKQHHQGVRIGYFTSNSHLENAQLIENAVTNVLMKYSNVIFYYTKSFQGFMDKIPKQIESQVNYLPFFPLKDYLKYVNNLGIDIGLAPLMDNDFNKAKSNIRILEYWQNGISVVASPLDEYSKTITHGFDGYLSQNNEWEHWIDDLIKNPERRNYLVKNSKETLARYDIGIFAYRYYKILRELVK